MEELRKPAVALAAVPRRRRAALELAQEIERRDFEGIYCASAGDGLGLCLALALGTRHIPFGTAIANLYTRQAGDYAATTALIEELAPGRFRFGVGVSHAPLLERLGVRAGRPLEDVRRFVESWRATPRTGEQPKLVLAALRKKMVALAGELGDGVVFANCARSHVPESLAALPAEARRRDDFFVGCMIPTVVSDDLAAAAEVNRRTLQFYLRLPNYRRYWKEAGYVEEMTAVEKALAAGERERLGSLMSDAWLADCTLAGPAERIREGVAAWRAAGVSTPILVPSSVDGHQFDAFRELFAVFDRG